MERRKVSTPKEFFVSERDRFYSDWTLSFWREFFQNSVDAGAKRIDISVETSDPRGSFDDPASSRDSVTRIVFSDDGCGMSESVLNNVYFSIGATTKEGGDNIGGYGRARLMTCFANLRYSILTTDRFVMGDGADWVNFSLNETLSEIGTAESKLRAGLEDQAVTRAVSGLSDDRKLVESAVNDGGYRGCRIEVDLDPTTGRYGAKPTKDFMLSRLREYLSESQLAPKVFINGRVPEEFFGTGARKVQSRRGAVRRQLSIDIDGALESFANVHLNESEQASHKGKVIVRVAGASMFTEQLGVDVQVIVELDPKTARDAMTSNRDGLRGDYRRSLQNLIQEIVVDNKSALKDRKSERIKIDGQRGYNLARRPDFRKLSEERASFAEIEAAETVSKAAPATLSTPLLVTEAGLPIEAVEAFMRSFRAGDTFANDGSQSHGFRFRGEFINLQTRVNTAAWGEEADLFFSALSPEARTWLTDVLKERVTKAESAIPEEDTRISDLNDIVIHVENTNPSIRSAIRRNDPRNWDVSSGKGRQPRSLLVMWTEACRAAVKALMKVRPSTDEFPWTTGWCYDVAQDQYQGDRTRQYVTKAMCVSEDGKHAFLVNPVTQDGRLAFNPSSPEDRQKLQALAMHEVAHVHDAWHNESYAGILTDLMEVYDYREANRAMKSAVKAVAAAYDRGKAFVQPMDEEAGMRPSQRLLEGVMPQSAADGSMSDVITLNNDGTHRIDCDDIDEVERNATPDVPEDTRGFEMAADYR
jgi:hypothetical protein